MAQVAQGDAARLDHALIADHPAERPALDRDLAGFSRHISMPILMVNGRSDNFGQEIMLGYFLTPPAQKRLQPFDGDHTLAGFEKDVKRVNLDWFDKYLGSVVRK